MDITVFLSFFACPYQNILGSFHILQTGQGPSSSLQRPFFTVRNNNKEINIAFFGWSSPGMRSEENDLIGVEFIDQTLGHGSEKSFVKISHMAQISINRLRFKLFQCAQIHRLFCGPRVAERVEMRGATPFRAQT